MSSRIFATTGAIAKVTVLALLVVVTAGASMALAAPDPDLEMFRVRCQIDADVDPATGLTQSKVQIQGKARAELLDGMVGTFTVSNGANTSAPVTATFDAGSASADWDTFPDLADPEGAATPIASDFAVGGDTVTVSVSVNGQDVSNEGVCASKVSSQFQQDTKNVCTQKKFNKRVCKPGSVLSDGTEVPADHIKA